MQGKPNSAAARAQMVEDQLRRRGIADERLLHAMAEVRRETFVAPEFAAAAYDDTPLPIGADQTISQPFMVATMIEAAAIGPRDRVLDVGTGSGYAAAVLGRLAGEVYTIERHAALCEEARTRLSRQPGAIHVRHGDGCEGWRDAAPFDAILVAAAGPRVPQVLKDQLAAGGRLIAPIGERSSQRLVKLTRLSGGRFAEVVLAPVLFVPLVAGTVA